MAPTNKKLSSKDRSRPVESLKLRYLKVIAKAVGKFNKFFWNLKMQNKSGWTKEDYIEEAA
jgi:hypothetical protein